MVGDTVGEVLDDGVNAVLGGVVVDGEGVGAAVEEMLDDGVGIVVDVVTVEGKVEIEDEGEDEEDENVADWVSGTPKLELGSEGPWEEAIGVAESGVEDDDEVEDDEEVKDGEDTEVGSDEPGDWVDGKQSWKKSQNPPSIG